MLFSSSSPTAHLLSDPCLGTPLLVPSKIELPQNYLVIQHKTPFHRIITSFIGPLGFLQENYGTLEGRSLTLMRNSIRARARTPEQTLFLQGGLWGNVPHAGSFIIFLPIHSRCFKAKGFYLPFLIFGESTLFGTHRST